VGREIRRHNACELPVALIADAFQGTAMSSFMSLALEQARLAAARGEVPIGAVLVDAAGQVLAAAGNRTEELNDPSAHAEILAIRMASDVLRSPRLPECDLYVTLEPCPMCAQAISFARIRRLYFGAPDAKGGGVEHGPRIFTQPTCHHRPEIYGGIGEVEAGELIRGFFRERR
jgi:tRNA(Arg) A34 adenosine deaminase TadA